MTMSYVILIFLGLKISNIAKGKSKKIKFPNLWIMPGLFIVMIIEDLAKGHSTFSLLILPILAAFAAAGLLVGWVRGRSLHYQKDTDSGEVYYQESYQSLIIYAVLIAVKWGLKSWGGTGLSFMGTGLIVFACGSMIGRCGYISYQYLRARQDGLQL